MKFYFSFKLSVRFIILVMLDRNIVKNVMTNIPKILILLLGSTDQIVFFFLKKTFFFLKNIYSYLFIHLAPPGLSCGVWDLVPDQDLNLAPCAGGTTSQPLDHQGSPGTFNLQIPLAGLDACDSRLHNRIHVLLAVYLFISKSIFGGSKKRKKCHNCGRQSKYCCP